ncbi:hypothetical protein UFOVP647_2 [uncultured Caudovirales phage]|uniref:Uncharacterized protein n=1 Tax=uncultured Caudovirales phage TaxID=2100421 RepID=A0A6J5NBD5_9CAUD|nr:hypothetical protein UFOVP647_2 [uncultured Caudovirales phage]
MNQNEFKQRIKEIAEIKELKPATSPNIRLDETDENDVRIGNQWTTINKEVNPTLGFKLLKLKDQYRACDLGCGEVIANQVIERRLTFSPQKHWRTRCATCSRFVSPDGTGFINGGANIQNAYIKFYAEKKRKD